MIKNYEYLHCPHCDIFFKSKKYVSQEKISPGFFSFCLKCGSIVRFRSWELPVFTEVKVAKLLLMGRWYNE